MIDIGLAQDMDHGGGVVLVTGTTGLVGARVVRQWLGLSPRPLLAVLVRDLSSWRGCAARMRIPYDAVVPLAGDITREGLGLARGEREWLSEQATAVLHLAADTTFSRPIDVARRVNRDGTGNVLDLASSCANVTRFAFVSTAFVSGRRTGRIPESDAGAADAAVGWVNAYEQSKAEAEALVRASCPDALILRSSTIAANDVTGTVTQRNAVHRALRLFHDGFAAMIPGVSGSMLDAVPADYVADGIARLALREGVDGATLHLCAGAGAMPLEELLDVCYSRWARDAAWRRRGISRPSLGDLETYDLFTQTVDATGNARLRQVTSALSCFLPQLALPKQFDTGCTDAWLGRSAPAVRDYWCRMIDHLSATSWQGVAGLTEVAA